MAGLTNWFDVLLAILLLEAAIRGFVRGFWVTLLSLGGTVAGLIGAYCFTGPVVRLLEGRWHIVSWLEQTLFSSLAAVPALNVPFGPSTIANISDFVSRYPAIESIATVAEKALMELLGTHHVTTAGEALAVLFAALLVRTVVFLLLVALIRALALLLARSLDLATQGSLILRLMGSALEVALRTLWLAVLTGGVVYPLVLAGGVPFLRGALESSKILPPLLAIYQVVAGIAFGWLRP